MLSGTKVPEDGKDVKRPASNEDGENDAEPVEISKEELERQSPLMKFSELRFLLTLNEPDLVSAAEKKTASDELVALVKQHNMTQYYQSLMEELKTPVDAALVTKMKAANESELKAADAKIEDMEKTAGEVEVRDAKLVKANIYALIGDKKLALDWYDQTMEKTVGSGGRIDLVLSVLRMAFCLNDLPLIRKNIAKAKGMVEKGGDWERKNQLHIYEAVFLILTREFKDAAKLLLDSIATFSCYPLFNYTAFTFYTVLTSLITLDRVSLNKKVILSPDVLSVIRDVPHLKDLAFSLYECKYGLFFESLAAITPTIKRDRFMSVHFNYYLRELRIVAYTQFLESYRSVTLASMATSFGVSVAFLDRELSRFINSGRLNCKIDKVGGVVETNRPDIKNVQYNAIIKHGDALLARIQKLTKIVSF